MCLICERPSYIVENFYREMVGLCPVHRSMYTCEDCGRVIGNVAVYSGRQLCLSCIANYARCIDCGTWMKRSKLRNYEYDWICENCYGINYRACHCGYLSAEFYDDLCSYCYRDEMAEYCRDSGSAVKGETFEQILSSRWYGIEIETDNGRYDKVPKQWGIKLDGSINGLELVSPLMRGDEGLDAISELYEQVEPTFDDRCGIHVHVDVRDLNGCQKLDLVRAFENTKKHWWKMVPKHRAENVHCKGGNLYPIWDIWETWYARNEYDRYRWVNFNAVEDHGSVELRILDGCGVEKTLKWVAMVVNFVEQVVNMNRNMPTNEFSYL